MAGGKDSSGQRAASSRIGRARPCATLVRSYSVIAASRRLATSKDDARLKPIGGHPGIQQLATRSSEVPPPRFEHLEQLPAIFWMQVSERIQWRLHLTTQTKGPGWP